MIKVLLVDDHELVRTGIQQILTRAGGVEVVGAVSSGEEALQQVAQLKPDIVLMDVRMPGMGGIEATRRILCSYPSLKVIALTVHDEDPFPARLHEAGAMGYLTKGCPADEMLNAIHLVAKGFPYISSEMAKKHALAEWSGQDQNTSPFVLLSHREMQVAMLILEGKKNQEVSDTLNLSPKTVSTYRQRVYEKLSVANDVELTRLAYRFGIIE
ncbi:MAG: response regulator [Candidatus Polarisedimenticolaceae bacterium]|nr:response regulator [Candidatus Polarisedimenticolaceae bacterium]